MFTLKELHRGPRAMTHPDQPIIRPGLSDPPGKLGSCLASQESARVVRGSARRGRTLTGQHGRSHPQPAGLPSPSLQGKIRGPRAPRQASSCETLATESPRWELPRTPPTELRGWRQHPGRVERGKSAQNRGKVVRWAACTQESRVGD